MISYALDGRPLPIYGDGKQECYLLHVEDHCRAILAVLDHSCIGEIYNIGGINIEEKLAMAQRLLRLMGRFESLLSHVEDRPAETAATL